MSDDVSRYGSSSGNVSDISATLQARRIVRLERCLRSFLIFFGMDEREEIRSMFEEARRLTGHRDEVGDELRRRHEEIRDRVRRDLRAQLEDLDPKWETVRDLGREGEILARSCGLCGSSLVLAEAFHDTGRPNRVRCSNWSDCGALYRVDYESPNWDLRLIDPAKHEAT